MSVINKMLRDLDARHAAGDRKNLPNEVRPLPEDAHRRPPLMAVTGALIVVGIIAWAWWITSENTVSPPSVLPAPQVATVSSPAVAVATVAGSVAEPPSVSVPPSLTAPGAQPVTAPAPPLVVVAPSGATTVTPAPPATAATAVSGPSGTPVPLAKEMATTVPPEKELTAAKAESSSAKRTSPAGVSSLRLETSLRPTPPMAEASAPKSVLPVEKQVHGVSLNEQAEAAYRRAAAANRQGRSSEAVEALREALKADPRHISARQLFLSILVERKQLDEASTLLREGLELLPQQSAWAMALARIEVEKGQLSQAWETLQRHLPQAENNADYRGFAGTLLQRLQKPKEAVPHYQAALRLKPAESRWWLGLGLALEADGRVAEAREAYQKAQAANNLGAEGAALVEQKLR